MNFVLRSQLADHIHILENGGWLIPEWHTEEIEKDGKPMTRAYKLYKVNFDNFEEK